MKIHFVKNARLRQYKNATFQTTKIQIWPAQCIQNTYMFVFFKYLKNAEKREELKKNSKKMVWKKVNKIIFKSPI